jgi:hypothetical protein
MSTKLVAIFGVGPVTEKDRSSGYVLQCQGTFDARTANHAAALRTRLLDDTVALKSFALPPELAEKIAYARTVIDNPDWRIAGNASRDIEEAIAFLRVAATAAEVDADDTEFFPAETIAAVLTLDWGRFAGRKPLAALVGSQFKVTIEAISYPTNDQGEPVDAVHGHLVSGRRL